MTTREPTINNRRARHDYAIEKTYECGIILEGSEVKSLRAGHAQLTEAYARVDNGEVWLFNMQITPYEFSRGEIDPQRKRKLLLKMKEIGELYQATQEKGFTLIPLKAYFKNGRVKIELGVGKGKKTYDKRESIKKRTMAREAQRDAQRAMKGYR